MEEVGWVEEDRGREGESEWLRVSNWEGRTRGKAGDGR